MKGEEKVYIIAEIGINHNGSLENCLRMIDAVSVAGADAVKLQFFRAANLYPKSAGRLNWRGPQGSYSYDIYGAVESFELPLEWIKPLVKYCQKKGLRLISSVFDPKGADLLVREGIKILKIASTAITNLPLVEHCARYRLPLIISTGAASLGEIEEAVQIVNRHHSRVSLLHCSLKYPTALKDCNLGIIQTLRLAFPKNKIGYSDHSKEISQAAVQAVYLGAEIIEKHITLDKKMPGPDHYFALGPTELRKMVKDIRQAEEDLKAGRVKIDQELYGRSEKLSFAHERYLRDFCYMSIFAARPIKKGRRIKLSDLCILRPGKKEPGLEPKYLDLFKRYKICASRNIREEEAVDWGKVFHA